MGFDIFGFIKDLTTATGLSKIIELIGDAISILGDLVAIISQVATLFKWSSAQSTIDTISSVINIASGLYKLARGVMHSPWGVLAQAAILTGFYTLKAAFIEGDFTIYAEATMSDIVAKATGFDASKIGAGIGHFIQAFWNGYQNQIDTLTNESDDQFCQSNAASCN